MDIKESTEATEATSPFLNSYNGVNEQINVIICPTTGGQFEINISVKDTISNLQKKIARHLQTPQERLRILFKEKLLLSGHIHDHNIQDGSKLTLVPAVESGFSSTVQGTQQSIIQAIESLSDVQIDDFLSGRSPLTLALRVGDHMMFVQLQLEQSMASSGTFIDSSSEKSRADNVPQSSRSHRHHDICERRNKFPNCTTSATTASNSNLWRGLTSNTKPAANVNSETSKAIPTSPYFDPVMPFNKHGTDLPPYTLNKNVNKATPESKPSPIDKLVTACSSFEVSSSGANSTITGMSHSSMKSSSASSTNSDSSTGNKTNTYSSNSSRSYQYRRASTTCGKITSGVGSLTHHGSLAGARMVRHMQRLRRLCGAHQQCVAYSSPELASEISSIVHAAKYHNASESGSSSSYHHHHHHRRNGKCSARDRFRGQSGLSHRSGSEPGAIPATGASIDSVTTHGPGIFSGTFSGSLHPNIQDSQGRPKRDPQTILQILTDLLSATNQYEGQTGNVGMLPQLFKDHFNKQSPADASPPARQPEQEPRSERSRHSRSRHSVYHHPYTPHANKCQKELRNSSVPYMTSSPSGISPQFAACQQMVMKHKETSHRCGNSRTGWSFQQEGISDSRQKTGGKCPHGHSISQLSHRIDFNEPPEASSCIRRWQMPSRSRRCKKQAPSINVSKLQQLQNENYTTRQKMKRLKERMQIHRMRRQIRRQACLPYKRTRLSAIDGIITDKAADMNSELNSDLAEGTGLDVQIEELSEFTDKRKTDVAHESPETVTV